MQDDDFFVNVKLSERQEADYRLIRSLIRTGGDLSPFYRKSDTGDWLLKTRTVLHLHLGGAGSNAILYVVQYPGHVLFIGIDTHVHLDDVPVGKQLPIGGRKRFQAELQLAHEDDANRLARSVASVKAGKPKPG